MPEKAVQPSNHPSQTRSKLKRNYGPRGVVSIRATLLPATAQISFAEETVECRRVQLLQYFGETFDSSNCNKTCDVCQSCSGTVHESRDMSPLSLELLDLVTATNSAFSLNHVVDVFYGSMSKTVRGRRVERGDSWGGEGLRPISVQGRE